MPKGYGWICVWFDTPPAQLYYLNFNGDNLLTAEEHKKVHFARKRDSIRMFHFLKRIRAVPEWGNWCVYLKGINRWRRIE